MINQRSSEDQLASLRGQGRAARGGRSKVLRSGYLGSALSHWCAWLMLKKGAKRRVRKHAVGSKLTSPLSPSSCSDGTRCGASAYQKSRRGAENAHNQSKYMEAPGTEEGARRYIQGSHKSVRRTEKAPEKADVFLVESEDVCVSESGQSIHDTVPRDRHTQLLLAGPPHRYDQGREAGTEAVGGPCYACAAEQSTHSAEGAHSAVDSGSQQHSTTGDNGAGEGEAQTAQPAERSSGGSYQCSECGECPEASNYKRAAGGWSLNPADHNLYQKLPVRCECWLGGGEIRDPADPTEKARQDRWGKGIHSVPGPQRSCDHVTRNRTEGHGRLQTVCDDRRGLSNVSHGEHAYDDCRWNTGKQQCFPEGSHGALIYLTTVSSSDLVCFVVHHISRVCAKQLISIVHVSVAASTVRLYLDCLYCVAAVYVNLLCLSLVIDAVTSHTSHGQKGAVLDTSHVIDNIGSPHVSVSDASSAGSPDCPESGSSSGAASEEESDRDSPLSPEDESLLHVSPSFDMEIDDGFEDLDEEGEVSDVTDDCEDNTEEGTLNTDRDVANERISCETSAGGGVGDMCSEVLKVWNSACVDIDCFSVNFNLEPPLSSHLTSELPEPVASPDISGTLSDTEPMLTQSLLNASDNLEEIYKLTKELLSSASENNTSPSDEGTRPRQFSNEDEGVKGQTREELSINKNNETHDQISMPLHDSDLTCLIPTEQESLSLIDEKVITKQGNATTPLRKIKKEPEFSVVSDDDFLPTLEEIMCSGGNDRKAGEIPKRKNPVIPQPCNAGDIIIISDDDDDDDCFLSKGSSPRLHTPSECGDPSDSRKDRSKTHSPNMKRNKYGCKMPSKYVLQKMDEILRHRREASGSASHPESDSDSDSGSGSKSNSGSESESSSEHSDSEPESQEEARSPQNEQGHPEITGDSENPVVSERPHSSASESSDSEGSEHRSSSESESSSDSEGSSYSTQAKVNKRTQGKRKIMSSSSSESDSEDQQSGNESGVSVHSEQPRRKRRPNVRYTKLPSGTYKRQHLMRDLSLFVKEWETVTSSMMIVNGVTKKQVLELRAQLLDVYNIQVSKVYTHDVGPCEDPQQSDVDKFRKNIIYASPLHRRPLAAKNHLLYTFNIVTASLSEWLNIGKVCVDYVVRHDKSMTLSFAKTTTPVALPPLRLTGDKFIKMYRKTLQNTTHSPPVNINSN